LLDSIITSKARIRVLMKFFLNPSVKAYLRELASEFGDSTNSVRVELNRLVEARLLKSDKIGRNIYYSANTAHPLFPEINSILRKVTGIDKICEIISHLGKVDKVYVAGDYAKGIDSGIVDIIVVGRANKRALDKLVAKTEKLIGRKIRFLLLAPGEYKQFSDRIEREKLLPIWG